MPAASIKVNGVGGHPPAGADDLPIGEVVQLDNDAVGDESTYLWVIRDQPPGPTDTLSDPTIKNPTFTPSKEGSYLIELVVDYGLLTQAIDSAVCAVRQVKTRYRVPAAGEEVETQPQKGWALSVNELLRRVDSLAADTGTQLVVVGGEVTVSAGTVCKYTDVATLKSGLPGQEKIPVVEVAPATDPAVVAQPLCVLIANLTGSSTASPGDLATVRTVGLMADVMSGGSPAVGGAVYVDDSAALSLTSGSLKRIVGYIVKTADGIHSVYAVGSGSGAGGGSADQSNIIYVGKHGNDDNNGRSEEQALQTFGAALTLAAARFPGETPISIVCLDAGVYTESLDIPPFVWVYAPNASIIGQVNLSGSSGLEINGILTQEAGMAWSVSLSGGGPFLPLKKAPKSQGKPKNKSALKNKLPDLPPGGPGDAYLRFKTLEFMGAVDGLNGGDESAIVNRSSAGTLYFEGERLDSHPDKDGCSAVGGAYSAGPVIGRLKTMGLGGGTEYGGGNYGVTSGSGILLEVEDIEEPFDNGSTAIYFLGASYISIKAKFINTTTAFVLAENCTLYLDCPSITGNTFTAENAHVIGQPGEFEAVLTYENLGDIGAPVNRVVRMIRAVVTEAFDGDSPVLIVGDSDLADRLIGALDVDLTVEGEVVLYPVYFYETAAQIIANIAYDGEGSAPTQGSVSLYFC